MPILSSEAFHPPGCSSAAELITWFIDAIATPVVADDNQGNIIHLNAAFTRTFGYTKSDVPNLAVWWPLAYPDPEYRAWVVKEWYKRLHASDQGHIPFPPLKVNVRTKSGSFRTVLASGTHPEQISRKLTIITFHDITEQEQAEAALRASNQQLDLALAGSGLGVWDCDLECGHVTYDQRWCQMLGYRPEEIKPDLSTWQNLIHPDDRTMVDAAVHRHLRGETEIYQTEHRLRHKDGHWVWVVARGRIVMRDAEGTPTRVTGTQLDISAQKRLSSEGFNLLHRIEALIKDVTRHESPTPRPAPSAGTPSLTERQREILALVAEGKSSAEIARLLNISTATVVTHRRDMMKRLGVRNAAALVQHVSLYPQAEPENTPKIR